MSLLQVITKACANPNHLTSESNYPIILNTHPILLNLKPQSESPNDASLVNLAHAWQISQTDTDIIQLAQNFYKNLKPKLNNPITLNKDEFLHMLNSYLDKNRKKVGISLGVQPHPGNLGYTCVLMEKLGFIMGPAVVALVLEGCVVLELWELLETMIVHKLVEHSCSSNLINDLIQKKRSDLVCLCVKYVSDIQVRDIVCILKYFLSPPKDAYTSMVSVRKEWDSTALSAIEKATDKSLGGKKSSLAKDASILLMIAHDGFAVSELCLHYLVSSSNLDEVILSSCISQLSGSEMIAFIQYLVKWVKKYEKFPQAYHSPKFSSSLGLKACEWIPTLGDVSKCLGLVVDEHFSSLVLQPEFHEDLKSVEGAVNSLSSEARTCCIVANLADNLRTEIKGQYV